MTTAVSLFAGIGGIDKALENAGIRVVAAAEIDPACRQILARHFPHTTLFDDVTKVTGDQLLAAGFLPDRGVLAAGWPCQDNSVAGRRQGMAGTRSSLWRHVVRLLAETRAAWFLGENVPGLLSVNGGRDFAACCDDLARLGMGFAWRVLDAQHFGVPQRRRRVFVVGHSGDQRAAAPVQVLFDTESSGGDPAPGGTTRPGTTRASDGGADVAFALRRDPGGTGQGHNTNYVTVGTLQSHCGGWRVGADEAAAGQLIPFGADASEDGTGRGTPLVAAFSPQTGGDMRLGYGPHSPALTANQTQAMHAGALVRRLTPLECERLQGFPDQWTAGQSDSARYRQLGNAVAVPCVTWITRRIAEAAS